MGDSGMSERNKKIGELETHAATVGHFLDHPLNTNIFIYNLLRNVRDSSSVTD
jgi:hypothetical protein